MEIKVIASSSKGNCYLLDDSKTQILIEAGITFNKLIKKVNISNISGVLVTHEHQDHAKGISDLIRRGKRVYSAKETFDALGIKTPTLFARELKEYEKMMIGTFAVIPFLTKHDAAKPLGFLIKSIYTKQVLLFATDTYYIKEKFQELNFIMIECNYANDILEKRENISKKQKDRLYKSHFELENVKEFLRNQDLSQVQEIYLMHLSSGNSDEERFKREIQELTGIPVYVCQEE
jgi:phosphoribosyl 1,2-cyclic phosphodiesterase